MRKERPHTINYNKAGFVYAEVYIRVQSNVFVWQCLKLRLKSQLVFNSASFIVVWASVVTVVCYVLKAMLN